MLCVGKSLQTVCVSGILVIIAKGFIVSLTIETNAGQGPAGSLVVSVTTAMPEGMDGVKRVAKLFAGLKLPSGELQVADEAPPEMVPVISAEEPAQIVTAGPALTPGVGNTEITTSAVSEQPVALTISV